MPTKPDPSPPPSSGARLESERWAAAADAIGALPPLAPAAIEAEVVGFYDPGGDLDARAARWGYALPDHHLASLCRFAAGLAAAEADAWESGPPDIAAAAFGERRHLVADRIIHWAVPWLAAVSDLDAAASPALDAILAIGDSLRPAPAGSGGEGVYPPGHDAFGPLPSGQPDEPFLSSLWSGGIFVRGLGEPDRDCLSPPSHECTAAYHAFAGRWADLAVHHQGSAALWADLAARAAATAEVLGAFEKA